MQRITSEDLQSEIQITTTRSGGPGGQHVNKVETKVTLRWKVGDSEKLSATQKQLIREMYATKLTKEDELILTADSKRSQLQNKELVFKKLDRMLEKAFTKRIPRRATKPSKASKQKRLNAKKQHGEKKAMRKRIQ